MRWLPLLIMLPYLYLLTRIWKSLYGIKPYLTSKNPDHFVSIIVACKNEEVTLPLLLHDISLQDYDQKSFEVIIVNDHSNDMTPEIASGFRNIRNFKILNNSGSGKKKAVRTGVDAASGILIITTDADCRMGKNWLSTIVSFYADHQADLVICPVMLDSGSGLFHHFQELEYMSLQGITAGTAIAGNPVMCNGGNMAFLKKVYERHSDNLHDDIASGDDVFLLHSIKEEPGNKIMWLESRDALVRTNSADTLVSYIKQRARWISKAGSYKDSYTRALAIVTFVTILLQVFLLFAGICDSVFIPVFLAAYLLKSFPDFLIIKNTAFRYNKRNLLWLFLPAQIIYPFYVLAVFFYFLTAKKQD
jgi:cellulose synthase/poly-beta-1,6-N-acetylglucosamine synthase-like glycosyltransferase